MISFVKFFERYTSNKGIPASGDIIIVISEQGGSIDSSGRISGDAMKTMMIFVTDANPTKILEE